MHLAAHLDLDVIAHETADQVSVLAELTAPQPSTGIERPPSTLVVVLDRSGSMAGERLASAQSALLALVDRLDPRDRFGLVTFDDRVTVTVPTGPLTAKHRVKQAIAAVAPGGSTDLSSGYFRGLQEARRVADRSGATVILLSDGHANAGLQDPGQLGAVAGKAHADQITTSTLGLGLGYDEQLLSAIARGGAGNELFASNADESIALLGGEVEGLLSVTAQAASLLVRMSPLVHGVRVINELPSIVPVPDGLLIELGSFYAGEVRKLVLTFDVPAVPALGLAEIARLEFSYVALPALEQQTISLPLMVNVVPGDEAAGRVPDPVVRTELAFQQAQVAKRAASSALSSGRTDAAGEALQAARTALLAVGASAPAPLIAELHSELDLVQQLQADVDAGEHVRAAKFSSADASLKSRTRGRTR